MSDEPYQVDTNQHTLRDRIAAVLRDRLLNEIEGAVNGVDNIYVGDYVGESAIHLTPLADAVIAALLDMPLADWIALIASRPDVLKESRGV